ncbi:SIMPL domain-containing protein [Maribacter aestuarii]|uniref:SIMPL domain-containing protein n=1 Tax=Maribacter aestuarii TaxID=1130723 RepID=UPI00248C5775|nr:SIMPL domain-containing protein [Maribacter aestuarii]
MKKNLLALLLFFTAQLIIAQTTPNSINVNGTTDYSISPEYSSKMIVSLNNVYYDAMTMSLDEVKSTYLDKLSKAGIKTDQLTEDALYYALLGYEKEGTVMTFKTTSIAEMQKFLNVKSIGVSRSDTTMEARLTDEQMANYAKAAFDNAKEKAEAISQKIGRSIGKAISISDTNNNEITESVYYGNTGNKRVYYISVSFELL